MGSCKRLSARVLAFPDTPLSFDKDDDDTLDFVLATANLRATAYGIPNKTRFQVKGKLLIAHAGKKILISAVEMAGNIIPAIATTNAIIAGLIVMQSLNILSRIHSTSNGDSSNDSSDVPVRNVFLRTDPTKPLGSFVPQHPDPTCSVCRDVYIPFKADVGKCTLGQFVEDVVKGWLGSAEFEGEGEGEDVEWTVFEGGRLLADPDFEDNFERTLEDLRVARGKILTVRDEDTNYRPVHFCVCQP